MANKITVNVEGLGDLTQKFERMNLSTQHDVKKIIRNSTLRIQTNARKLAREQDVYDTGYLIRNIKANFLSNGLMGEVKGGAEYHIFHEIGTRKMPARPMLYPAAVAEKPKYLAAIAQAIEKGARS